MRIFIGLIEIAGYYTNLKKGFDALGIESTFIDLSGHPFAYAGARRPGLLGRLLRPLRRAATALIRSRRALEALHRALQTVLGLPLLLWAVCRYDVFIFGFGSSLLGFWDLPILKALGKKVIHVFHGSDFRPPYIDGAQTLVAGGLAPAECIRAARRRKRILRRIERYADVVMNHPTEAQFHERPFVVWTRFGMPFSAPGPDEPGAAPASAADRPVRILHSPSQPEVKGTARIREAVERLKARGCAIDYVEVSGVPHAVVLRELARADFVVDQLYSDTYLAGFATEAAHFGKPAVVGGYAWEELARVFPPDARPPVHACHPDRVEEAIERLVVDEAYRLDLGRRARAFVRERCAPRRVAECYLRILEGTAPKEWMYDPKNIRYVHGVGLPEDRCRALVRAVIELGGVEALQLSDKPDLERLFVAFAGQGAE